LGSTEQADYFEFCSVQQNSNQSQFLADAKTERANRMRLVQNKRSNKM
jgi:hypothetical protein